MQSKPKVLKRKNIRRRTGARSQSKQILALTRSVSKITKENFERIRTCWQINEKAVGSALTGITSYICPIPYAPMDPLGTSPVQSQQFWADNNMPTGTVGQTFFKKRLVFGYSEAAANAGKIYHTGGILRYQILTTEPSYTKLTLALVKPKKLQADQISADRNLKAIASGSYPGSGSFLVKDTDFTSYEPPGSLSTSTTFGCEINTKYWTVIKKREIAMSGPVVFTAANLVRVTPITNPKNTSLVATGSFRLPAGGMIKNVSQGTQSVDNKSSPALENGYLDSRNEDCCYLVALHNDSVIDGQTVTISAVVNDYYKAVV